MLKIKLVFLLTILLSFGTSNCFSQFTGGSSGFAYPSLTRTPSDTCRCMYYGGSGRGDVVSNIADVFIGKYPDIAGYADNDYVWEGRISTDYTDADNWVRVESSLFSAAVSKPTDINNVFFIDYSGCGTFRSELFATYNEDCNGLFIGTGQTFETGNNSTLHVHGDFENKGSFTANQGTLEFAGTDVQTIETGGDTFYHLSLNNSDNLSAHQILLIDPLTVTSTIDFYDGILSTELNKLILVNGAVVGNSASINSFVDGTIERSGSSAFTFPTGDVPQIASANRPVYAPITTAACDLSTITAIYHYANPPYQWWYHDWTHESTLNHVTDREYWDLSSNNAYPAVTIYWTDNTSDIHSFHNTTGDEMTQAFVDENLAIAHYNTTVGKWENMGANIPTTSYFNQGSLSTTRAFTSYSPITFASKKKDFVLPVELISLNAKYLKESESVEILWQTASEINSDYFIVQKSKDLVDWNFVSKVSAAGNSVHTINYNTFDFNPEFGINYYRIVTYDYDASFKECLPVSVNINNNDEIIVSAANLLDGIHIQIKNSGEQSKFDIALYDMAGRLVYRDRCEIHTGETDILLNGFSPVNSQYVLHWHCSDETGFTKLFIENK